MRTVRMLPLCARSLRSSSFSERPLYARPNRGIDDWRWILQALNPDPDQASIPLLGRAYKGRSEKLLLRRDREHKGSILTVRIWDSGVRLLPGRQTLYFAQVSEEQLVQRFGLFSYWRSAPVSADDMRQTREALGKLEQKFEQGNLLLLRSYN